MKKILLCALLACNYIANAKDIYSVLQFVNKSDLSFDFSLYVKSRPSGSSGRTGYDNPAWLGKYSPDQLKDIPISFPNTPFTINAYYWTDQSFGNSYDWIGFNLKTPAGKTMGLTNKVTGDVHYCNFQGDDDGQIVVYSFEGNGGGYTLYAIMPSGNCSFSVTDGYGPWPRNSLDSVNLTSFNIDDGRKNAELEIHNNPALLKHLDQVYLEVTGINRKELRAKRLSQQIRPYF